MRFWQKSELFFMLRYQTLDFYPMISLIFFHASLRLKMVKSDFICDKFLE